MTNKDITLREMWQGCARRSPNKVAVSFEGTEVTYKQIVDNAGKLGKSLYALGAQHQSRISVLSKNCVEMFYIFASCNLHGFIAAPINYRLSALEVLGIAEDCTPEVLFFEDEFASVVEEIKPQLGFIKAFYCIGKNVPDWAQPFSDCLEAGGLADVPFEVRPEDIAHLLFTSGTTGKPKGVMRSHVAEYRACQRIIAPFEFHHGGKTLVVMPMYHVGAFLFSYAQFIYEGTVIVQPIVDLQAMLKAIEEEKAEVMFLAPTVLNDLVNFPDLEKYDVSSMRTIQYGAAPMSMALLKTMQEKMPSVGFIGSYGATEMTSVTFLYKNRHLEFDDPLFDKHLSSVGQVYPDSDLRIADDKGIECPIGTVGEVQVRTSTVMSGYWNNTKATIEAMPNGWYATGDMGYLDENEYLYLVDRKKDMIISGGENIYCREVEEALMAHGGLFDVAVIGVPDERWGESVRALAILKEGVDVSVEELQEFCRSQIARYKCPKSIIFLEDFPRLPSGKIKKTELRDMYSDPDL